MVDTTPPNQEDDEQPVIKNTRPRAKNIKDNGTLEGAAAEREMSAAGQKNAEWITKSTKSTTIKVGSQIPKHYNFTTGNYAMIYRGKRFLRFAPFLAKNDLESDQWWAEFEYHVFFGKDRSWWPWDLPSTKILWMGLDLSDNYCDDLGGGGRLIKVDESAKCQIPLYMRLNDEERLKILKNNRMNAQALLLKATLSKYEKPKSNWIFWLIIGVIVLAVAGILVLYATNPHIFSGLSTWFSNLTKGFSPPTAPASGT